MPVLIASLLVLGFDGGDVVVLAVGCVGGAFVVVVEGESFSVSSFSRRSAISLLPSILRSFSVLSVGGAGVS